MESASVSLQQPGPRKKTGAKIQVYKEKAGEKTKQALKEGKQNQDMAKSGRCMFWFDWSKWGVQGGEQRPPFTGCCDDYGMSQVSVKERCSENTDQHFVNNT